MIRCWILEIASSFGSQTFCHHCHQLGFSGNHGEVQTWLQITEQGRCVIFSGGRRRFYAATVSRGTNCNESRVANLKSRESGDDIFLSTSHLLGWFSMQRSTINSWTEFLFVWEGDTNTCNESLVVMAWDVEKKVISSRVVQRHCFSTHFFRTRDSTDWLGWWGYSSITVVITATTVVQ